MTMHDEQPMKPPRPATTRRDYDGIILDMLDDIVSAEHRAKRLIDRIDGISKHPMLRVVDIDSYCWILAAIAATAFLAGILTGYVAHFWLAIR